MFTETGEVEDCCSDMVLHRLRGEQTICIGGIYIYIYIYVQGAKVELAIAS